jgi:hypothetical protein
MFLDFGIRRTRLDFRVIATERRIGQTTRSLIPRTDAFFP